MTEWLIKNTLYEGFQTNWESEDGMYKKSYYKNLGLLAYYDKKGNHHREDGPARIWDDGQEEWWYNNERIYCHSQEEFERYLKLKAFW